MSSPEEARSVEGLVSHLFRRKAGEMVSLLTRVFGVERIELAEDVVQEALLKALQTWPYSGVPDNPGGWIFSVAKNRAMDVLRREQTLKAKLRGGREMAVLPAQQAFDSVFDDPFGDAQLTMVFLCCHPVLSLEAQIALTLKTVGGFGVSEIARAFLVPEQTVAQRLVRAKRVLKKQQLPFAMPTEEELRKRLDAVLKVIYLLFNEGYTVTEGGNLVREDLCGEAIRLSSLLAEHPSGDVPKVHALLALMFLQSSRFETRADTNGNLLLMAAQDRSRWNQDLIRQGLSHLQRAAAGDELSEYHMLAGIAACHSAAPTFEQTDWRRILFYYDGLMNINPSPVTAINRSVAIAMRDGPAAGLAALNAIEKRRSLRRYYLLPATYGEMYKRLGDMPRAVACYKEALALMGNEAERRFVKRNLDQLQ